MAISLDANANVQLAQQRISSGQRINSAKDDAAGSAISERLTAAIDGKNQAIKNAGDGISMLQTANGALSSITDGLQRLRELEVQSGNGTYSQEDIALLDKEKSQVIASIEDTVKSANFNGQSLFSEASSRDLQVGSEVGQTISVQLGDLSKLSENLGNLEGIDEAIATVTEQAVNVGAYQNRLDSSVDRLASEQIDAAQAKSRISDSDLAKEISNLTAANIQNQVDIAMQAQANQNQGQVLQLLQI